MAAAPPIRLAALVTDYRPGTHADVLLSKFLHGFPCDEPEVHTRSRRDALNLKGTRGRFVDNL